MKTLNWLKTKGFRLLCIPMICISGMAYGQASSRIADFKFTACSELFYTKDTLWRAEILPGNILSLNFTYEMPCTTYLYPEVLVITPDSVVMTIKPTHKKWDKNSTAPLKTLSVSEDYRGYYTFHIELSGLNKIPKEISINNKYHHSYFGFIDSDMYNSVKGKHFHNDSKSISYEQIMALIGKSLNDQSYRDFSRSLGDDYLEYDEAYHFVEDHIRMTFNSKNIITEIEVNELYKGTMPSNILLNDPVGKVIGILGDPDKRTPNNAILLKDNGEQFLFHESDTYYYKKYKLSLRVNNEGNISSYIFK